MKRDDLRQDLIRHEGLRLHPYRCTAGKLTIGVGRNLDDRGITEAEALALLDNDVAIICDALDFHMLWWRDMPEPAQRAIANMCFNLGWPRFAKFAKMLDALQAGDYAKAADEALDSRWAAQVPNRAQDIAALIRGS